MRPTIERTFVCPGINSQSDVVILQEAMENTPAVLEAEISLTDRTVHVKMGDLDGETSVRRHLASAGFTPED